MKSCLFACRCVPAGSAALLLLSASFLATASGAVKEYKSGIVWPEPPAVDPGPSGGPPSDAIVLFDGTDLSQWEGGEAWEIRDGYAIARKNGITTKRAFGDCQLHVEFATPPVVKGHGQQRGNSGIYLMNQYELQVLDSYDNTTYFDGQCGAIYKQQPPTVNACRPPGQWQTYDIIFQAPRFDAQGNVLQPAYITVLHNGVLIHNHFPLWGYTSYTEAPRYKKHPEKMPLHIQFHGNPVRFRNIWIRENIQPLVGMPPAPAPTTAAKPAAKTKGAAAGKQPKPKQPLKAPQPPQGTPSNSLDGQ